MNKKEITDLVISWLTISIAFAILVSPGFLNVMGFALAFPLSLIVVGTGFIFHELAHRQVALHFGAHAEYRAWNFGLIFALVSSLFGFIFAAPGAVYIYSNTIDRRQNGLISIAGPATNIIVSIGFLALAIASINEWTTLLGALGFRINMFLALFNLLPVPPLDGSKVFAWNPIIWIIAIAVSFTGVFFVPEMVGSLF